MKLDKREEKERRKDKKKLKRKWLKEQTDVTVAEENQISAKRARDGVDDDDDDDWAELAREEKMAKRVRKGGLSEKDFDAQFGDLAE